MKFLPLILLLALAGAGPALASWSLVNDESHLSFVSIKAGDVAEVHRFTEVSGEMMDDGRFSMVIQLASVDTMIPIRDERMRELLFETVTYPTAQASAVIDMDGISALQAGATTRVVGEVMLDLHGEQVPVTAELTIARLGDSRLLVTSSKPVVVNAANVDLAEGVEALREIAGLPSISKAVPVSFVLVFEADQ